VAPVANDPERAEVAVTGLLEEVKEPSIIVEPF
jgi:hypothetical protein